MIKDNHVKVFVPIITNHDYFFQLYFQKCQSMVSRIVLFRVCRNIGSLTLRIMKFSFVCILRAFTSFCIAQSGWTRRLSVVGLSLSMVSSRRTTTSLFSWPSRREYLFHFARRLPALLSSVFFCPFHKLVQRTSLLFWHQEADRFCKARSIVLSSTPLLSGQNFPFW